MTRPIKFRGRATGKNTEAFVDVGDWVHGYYYFDRTNLSHRIITMLEAESGGLGSGLVESWVEIDPDTLGQFTGLTDKNKKEAFEGDIARENDGRIYTVNWNDSEGRYGLVTVEEFYGTRGERHFRDIQVMEIIGNKFENPDLLSA